MYLFNCLLLSSEETKVGERKGNGIFYVATVSIIDDDNGMMMTAAMDNGDDNGGDDFFL